MAITPAGARLSEEHRRRQAQLAALVVAQIVRIWPAFNIRDIDASWVYVEPALMAMIAEGRRRSEDLAQEYFRRFRQAEGVPGQGPADLRAFSDWHTAATVSLRVTGPYTAKRLVGQKAPAPAQVALTRVSGAAMRIVGNGGRDVLGNGIRRDRRALGYARVTSGRSCAFCAMIAGRGPIYKGATAGFDAHDHCACTAEPVYSRDSKWPGKAREYEALYKSSTEGADDPLNAFRKAYEAA